MSATSMELSAARMLAIEVARRPRLSWEQEQAYVEQARRGNEKARSALVLDCQRYVLKRAYMLVRRFREGANGRVCRLEVLDVFSEGMVGVLTYLDRCLELGNPPACLRKAAYWGMLVYCKERVSVIRVPHTSFQRGKRAPEVVSLDAPLGDGEESFALVDILSS